MWKITCWRTLEEAKNGNGLTLEGLSGSFHQFFDGVTGQITSRVLGFAVSASVQTSKGQEDKENTLASQQKHFPHGPFQLFLWEPHRCLRWSLEVESPRSPEAMIYTSLACSIVDSHCLKNRVLQEFLRLHRTFGRVILLSSKHKFPFSATCFCLMSFKSFCFTLTCLRLARAKWPTKRHS